MKNKSKLGVKLGDNKKIYKEEMCKLEVEKQMVLLTIVLKHGLTIALQDKYFHECILKTSNSYDR